jgi:hypothetical protein
MRADLESIHIAILRAYKAVMLFSGVDVDDPSLQDTKLPIRHVPI